MWQIRRIIIVDKDITSESIEGIPVVSAVKNATEFLPQKWADEVFINLDEEVVYPRELVKRCSEMEFIVHLNLTKVTNSTIGKQTIGRVGEYNILTSSINVMTV